MDQLSEWADDEAIVVIDEGPIDTIREQRSNFDDIVRMELQ